MPKFEKYDLPAAAPAEAAAPAPEAAAAEAESPPGRSRRCPLCHGTLVAHGDDNLNPYKRGAYHCEACGVCWEHDLRNARLGHPMPKDPEPFEVR